MVNPPPPSGDILTLITSLSNHQNHAQHTAALQHQTKILSQSPITYSQTLSEYARVLSCPSIQNVPEHELKKWSESDPSSVAQMRHDPIGGWSQLREMTGLLLKNALLNPPRNSQNIKMTLLPDTMKEIKEILCRCIVDPSAGVRRVGSSLISSCSVGNHAGGSEDHVIADGMEIMPLMNDGWGPKILAPFLSNCIDSATGSMENNQYMDDKIQFALLGALQTLVKLLEDDAEKFERGTGAAFNKFVPAILKLLQLCGEERVKVDCVKCCVFMITLMPGSLVAQMNDLLGVLSNLAGDSSTEVKKYVCRAIVTLLSNRPEYLHEHILPVSQFMLTATSDTSHDVALEACEFWLVFASFDETMCTVDMMAAVEILLAQLLPILVKSMVYTEEKREELIEENEIDEEEADDRDQDVAPVFHKAKAKGGGYDDDDDDDDDDDVKEWSLRTCAAASLDSLSAVFAPSTTLPILLPVLQECLSHQDPWVREAGILALGAMGEGCAEEMYEHMGDLHPYLMNQVKSRETLPQVVCISAWTLARYAAWAANQTVSGQQPELIRDMTEAIVSRILDKNRKVQIACTSALGTIVETVEDLIVPYLGPIFQTLVAALPRHRTRSLLVTLETFGSIAEVVGPAAGEGNLPTLYIPSLIQMWNDRGKINPMDRVLLPLMESLASISMSIGMSYQPWALQTFEGAMTTINTAIMILTAHDYTDEEADPIVCATDVLDGLVEGLGPNFAELVQSSTQFKDHFLTVLNTLVGHDTEGVRMSAFALMGDIAMECPVLLQDGIADLISEAIACIDPDFPSVCNNAMWALGELFVKCIGNPSVLEPYAIEVVQSLISIMMGSSYGGEENPFAGLVENASTAMGRLAKANPAFVASDLPRCLISWLNGCAKISDETERVHAFEGLLMTIEANPNAIQQASPQIEDTIHALLFAILSWHLPSGRLSPSLLTGDYSLTPFPQDCSELHHKLGTFLHHLKNGFGADQWDGIIKHLPVNVRRLFREQYNLC